MYIAEDVGIVASVQIVCTGLINLSSRLSFVAGRLFVSLSASFL